MNGLPVSRTVTTERGLDPLAGTRRLLQNEPALTFEQLCWPTGGQLSGSDGGVYRACAQLLVNELLELKNGRAHLRAMLEMLPDCHNWQMAFQIAFRENFPRPLDVEKWWAVQVVSFVARDPGPCWTPAVSRDKLDEILSVPVEMRAASNALPAHAYISLQAVIRNFDRERQVAILQPKLRDLELAQLRMAAPLAALTDDYRRAIANYLGSTSHAAPLPHLGKHPPPSPSKTTVKDTLKNWTRSMRGGGQSNRPGAPEKRRANIITEYRRTGMAFGIPGLLLLGGGILTSHLSQSVTVVDFRTPVGDLARWGCSPDHRAVLLCQGKRIPGGLGIFASDHRHRSVGSGVASRPD